MKTKYYFGGKAISKRQLCSIFSEKFVANLVDMVRYEMSKQDYLYYRKSVPTHKGEVIVEISI